MLLETDPLLLFCAPGASTLQTLAYAILVEERIKVAAVKQVEVLRMSFRKTREAVRGLWHFLEVTEDMLTVEPVKKVVQRAMRQIAEMAIPKRGNAPAHKLYVNL